MAWLHPTWNISRNWNMELCRYNTFCRVIVQLKSIVTKFATKIYKCPGNNIPLSLKVAETNKIFYQTSHEVSLYQSFSHRSVRDINKRLVWKCIDSERRVRIKHCAKLTKRVLFERGSGVLFIVELHRIRISIWISKPSVEVRVWRGWGGASGSRVSAFIISAGVLGCNFCSSVWSNVENEKCRNPGVQ